MSKLLENPSLILAMTQTDAWAMLVDDLKDRLRRAQRALETSHDPWEVSNAQGSVKILHLMLDLQSDMREALKRKGDTKNVVV